MVDDTRAPAVRTVALTRHFAGRGGPRHALRGLDLTVHAGRVHGLLGPNGAGKSTLCRILSTVLSPTTGTAAVHGLDVVRDRREVQRLVGVSFGGERGLYPRLTTRENLTHAAALQRLGRAATRRVVPDLLERLGLGARADDRVETLSRGMKQRLHLARSLVADPPLLVVDEPTAGLDPEAADGLRSVLDSLRTPVRSILLTTHDLPDATLLCDDVSFLDEGRVVTRMSSRTFRDGAGDTRTLRIPLQRRPAAEHPATTLLSDSADHVNVVDGTLCVSMRSVDALVAAVHLLHAHGIHEYAITPPSLRDVYREHFGGTGLQVR